MELIKNIVHIGSVYMRCAIRPNLPPVPAKKFLDRFIQPTRDLAASLNRSAKANGCGINVSVNMFSYFPTPDHLQIKFY